jgi:hypothetical protein
MFIETLINNPQPHDFREENNYSEEIVKDNETQQARLIDRAVNKLNASIELQEFLFSTIQCKDNTDEFLKKINEIKNELENIEQRAQVYDIAGLINKDTITELRKKIKTYQEALQSS